MLSEYGITNHGDKPTQRTYTQNAKKETEKRERKTEWSQLEKQKNGSWRKKCKSVIIKDVRLYKKKKNFSLNNFM